MRLSTGLAIVCGATLTVLAVGAPAQNLVVNGDFDTGLGSWYWPPPWIETEWSALDAGGSPTSGSVRQENFNDDGTAGLGTGQCVPVVAGVSYRVSFSVYVPSGQTGTGLAGLNFGWNSSVDCRSSAGIGGLYGTAGTPEPVDEWSDLTFEWLEAPPGAQTMQVFLACKKTSVSGTFAAYWDDVFVVPEPGAAASCGAALLGLAAARPLRSSRARSAV
jgi:hypothetical protein